MPFPWEGLKNKLPSSGTLDTRIIDPKTVDLKGRRLLIGIPHCDNTTVQWAMSLALLIKPPDWGIAAVKGFPVDTARNMIVESALRDSTITDLVWIDSDIVPSNRDALIRLMASYPDLPFVSGIYYGKQFAGRFPTAWVWDANQKTHLPLSGRGQPGRLIQVDTVGFGFCRVQLDVFRKMTPPFFDFSNGRYDSEGKKIQGGVSEDFDLCRKLAKLDPPVKPVVDYELTAHHIGYFWARGDGTLDALGIEPAQGADLSNRPYGEETPGSKPTIETFWSKGE